MSMGLNFSVRKYGWRLGLQAITIFLISVFFIGNKLNMSNHFNDCNHCYLTNLCINFHSQECSTGQHLCIILKEEQYFI